MWKSIVLVVIEIIRTKEFDATGKVPRGMQGKPKTSLQDMGECTIGRLLILLGGVKKERKPRHLANKLHHLLKIQPLRLLRNSLKSP